MSRDIATSSFIILGKIKVDVPHMELGASPRTVKSPRLSIFTLYLSVKMRKLK